MAMAMILSSLVQLKNNHSQGAKVGSFFFVIFPLLQKFPLSLMVEIKTL